MNESEWLSSTNTAEMLDFLRLTPEYRLTVGKLRCFYDALIKHDVSALRIVASPLRRGLSVLSLSSDAKCAAGLLRDIFLNPFRANVYEISATNTDWRRWHDGLIPVMARTIYDERRFEEMPILADALEEAGCTNDDILMHCRGWQRCPWASDDLALDHGGKDWREMSCRCQGTGWVKLDAPHVRGCWVLDLLCGKA